VPTPPVEDMAGENGRLVLLAGLHSFWFTDEVDTDPKKSAPVPIDADLPGERGRGFAGVRACLGVALMPRLALGGFEGVVAREGGRDGVVNRELLDALGLLEIESGATPPCVEE